MVQGRGEGIVELRAGRADGRDDGRAEGRGMGEGRDEGLEQGGGTLETRAAHGSRIVGGSNSADSSSETSTSREGSAG